MAITLIGGILGMALTFPIAKASGKIAEPFFPVFKVPEEIFLMDLAAVIVVGLSAAIVPTCGLQGFESPRVSGGLDRMSIPLSYSFRNLWTRRLTTVLTASGMALVVFVFAAMLMLAGRTLHRKGHNVETGSKD